MIHQDRSACVDWWEWRPFRQRLQPSQANVAACAYIPFMDWEAPAVVLDVRPYGEGGVIATVLAEGLGAHRGLARGGASKTQAAIWQPGNIMHARWVGRLPEQLGTVSGELLRPVAALAMADTLALAVLSSCCALAAGALPEREPHPAVLDHLLRVLAHIGAGDALPEAVRWEATLLTDLGYGLDLSRCAVTGAQEPVFVSPRTGRAVAADAAGIWRNRLLPLPAFLRDATAPATLADCDAGLRLTGHFLERDAFGYQHRPLPLARVMLSDRVRALAGPPPA